MAPDSIVQIKDNAGNLKHIGEVYHHVFVSKRSKSKHLMKKINSWGLDCKVLDSFIKNNDVHYIAIIEQEENKTYLVPSHHFKLYAQVLQFGPHKPQYFLPISEFSVLDTTDVNDILLYLKNSKGA
ncbi:MAG: hypothetical protein N2043_01545 [Ignavibacterium sp.]|nr:hypothetical protein [Ignavibacterium sp.]